MNKFATYVETMFKYMVLGAERHYQSGKKPLAPTRRLNRRFIF